MKKSDSLKQARTALEAQINPLASKADRNDEENTQLRGFYSKLDDLNSEIDLEIRNEQFNLNRANAQGKIVSASEARDLAKYSISRAIRILSTGGNADSMDGIEGEMHREGANARKSNGLTVKGFVIPEMVLNHRTATGQNVTTAADGGNLVQDMPFMFVESLKNKLVLTEMGATLLTGLVGNLPLVKGGSFAASWVAEGSAVSFTKESFSKATLTPKNLMVAGAITKQLLAQTAGTADKLINMEMLNAIAQGIQAAAINGAGTPAPTGILNTAGIGSVVGGTDGAIPTWGNIVNLESEIANDNADMNTLAYLTNTKVRGVLKQTLKASGVAGYIWDGQGMNGYKAFVSNVVPSTLTKGQSSVASAIILGAWSELFIGLWGGLDIVVDPYSRADYNEVKLVFNQFADVALRNAESFAAMKDALVS